MQKFRHIHHLSKSFLDNCLHNYTPVFILNTGRSGSAFIDSLFDGINDIQSYHEAFPNLFLQTNFAYHNQNKAEVLLRVFEAARVELILEAALKDKIYIESNQCLVFYAHQIKILFPKAKFIHLTRHPGDFVTSAIKKGWHLNDSVWEIGRIKSHDIDFWENLSQIEKLGWVWRETHQYINSVKKVYLDDFFTIRLEDLVNDVELFEELLSFVGSSYNIDKHSFEYKLGNKINQLTVHRNEPENMNKQPDYPKYTDWPSQDKEDLKVLVSSLSKLYDYKL